MSWNLFSKEMRRNALSLMIWMIVITVLISVTMSAYPEFLKNQSKVIAMMSLFPKGLLQFKGVSNISDLLSVLGFYSVNNVIYMMVLGSVFAIVLSSNILLKEEYEKTAEYLLTRPISRSEIFISKIAVLLLNIILINLVATLAGYISLEVFKNEPYSIRSFLILSTYTLLLNLLFGAIGLFISTLVKRAKPITSFSIGLVLIFYFIFTISKIAESVSRIGYLSPFKYANMDAINPNYTLDLWHLIYFIGCSSMLVFLSYRLYIRKDIYT